MSENTPMRRRRPPQPVQIDDASIPHKSDEDNPVRPAREMPPHRRSASFRLKLQTMTPPGICRNPRCQACRRPFASARWLSRSSC